MTRSLALLGSTGSIGENTLDVVRASSGALDLAALCAGSNATLLAAQAREFRPRLVAIADPSREEDLRRELGDLDAEVVSGEEGVLRAATFPEADIVLSAVVGAAGILPAYHALKAGKDLALANKETLVAAGEVIMETAREAGRRILPVDSEHSALFQTLEGRDRREVKSICLTASGGPFWRDRGLDAREITPEDALKHPRWSMGDKVSIDSATLMNKGLEVIEAHWLFGFPLDRIEVLVHPQSIVHSVVEFVDGSMMAHLSRPDMRLPIASALYHPRKVPLPWPRLSLAEVKSLEFYPPDDTRFPALSLARGAQERGGGAPAALNAANEVAVAAFLQGRIRFPEIVTLSRKVLDKVPEPKGPLTIEGVLEFDAEARKAAGEIVNFMHSSRKV
jgi:1-deoxy-D-xylulose-5-phosphate reductoisomerase